MRSANTAARYRDIPASDAPRVDPHQKLPYGPGRVKPADIKKAVKAVVKERLAAERAIKAVK